MESQVFLKSHRFQAIHTFLWFTLFLISWLRSLVELNETSLQAFIYNPGAYFLVLWLLSPLINSFYTSSNRSSIGKQVVWHVFAAILFGMVHFLLTGFFTLVLERLFLLEEHYTLSSLFVYYIDHWPLILDGVGWYTIYLMMILLINYYFLFQNEKNRFTVSESNLASSNFKVLSTQLSPHFLFNAMNSIAMMVRKEENKKAVNMIASLSEMLRAAMSQKNNQFLPLKNEIELLEKYLNIEKVRFKGRVLITMSFPEEILQARVPQLVLQPIVENAFKHGVATTTEQVEILISGKKEAQSLVLSVYNSGLGAIHWDINNSKSLGLPNTVHRLRQVYDSEFSFKVIEQKEGILFQITIPFNESKISHQV